MSAVLYSREPSTKSPTFRVVYEDQRGKLRPVDTKGRVQDAKPTPAETFDDAKDYARYCVDGTLWTARAHVQERTFSGGWRTVYTYGYSYGPV